MGFNIHQFIDRVQFAALVAIVFASHVGATTIAHWRFEEGIAGNGPTTAIQDSSGNGLHGTAYGGLTYTGNTPNSSLPQTGDTNTLALTFDGGASTRVVVDDDPLFELTGSFTLEAYINLAALPATGFQWEILFRGDSRGGLDPYYLDVWDGKVRFTINEEPSGGVRVEAAAPALNQWTHIAGVLDDDTGLMALYFDGVLVDSTVTALRPFASLDPTQNPGLSIGGYPDNHYGPFRGIIDEVRISDEALSPDQFLNVPPVPEPATATLLFLGLGGLAWRRRRTL